jgi:hypothetical protein
MSWCFDKNKIVEQLAVEGTFSSSQQWKIKKKKEEKTKIIVPRFRSGTKKEVYAHFLLFVVVQKVQAAIQKAPFNPQLKNLLHKLEEFPNVPRKKVKFQVSLLHLTLLLHVIRIAMCLG